MNFPKAYKRIKELSNKKSDMANILEIYKSILEFQESSIKRIDLSIPEIKENINYSIKDIIKMLKEDDIKNLTTDFLKFISIFGTEKMKRIAIGAVESKVIKPSLVKALFTESREWNIPEIPPEFVHMLIFSTAPVLSDKIKESFPFLQENYIKENSICCPLCGTKAQVGFLKKSEEGKKYLICPFCYTEWPIKRDICPKCGNEELDEHFYFFIPEEKYMKVDICGSCKHYIKTIDERILDELNETCCPLVDEIATPYIDIKLLEKGYNKIQRNIFSL